VQTGPAHGLSKVDRNTNTKKTRKESAKFKDLQRENEKLNGKIFI
jgi:hypothetical protein